MEIRTLGDRLRARRMDLGLEQKEIAVMLGVSADSVCYWENNRVQPSQQLRSRILQFVTQDATMAGEPGNVGHPTQNEDQVRESR